MFVKVIIDNPSSMVDMEFEYETDENISIGSRVIVPFGKGDTPTLGIVLSISNTRTYFEPIKKIISVLDDEAIITNNQLQILDLIRNEAICPKSRILNMMIPQNLRLKKEKYLQIIDSSKIEPNLLNLFEGNLKTKYTDKFKPFKNLIKKLEKEMAIEVTSFAVEKKVNKYETYYELIDYNYSSISKVRMEIVNHLMYNQLTEAELLDLGVSKYALDVLTKEGVISRKRRIIPRIKPQYLNIKNVINAEYKESIDYHQFLNDKTKIVKFNKETQEEEFIYNLLKEKQNQKCLIIVPELLKGYVISSFINKHFDLKTCYINQTFNQNDIVEYYELIKKDIFDVVIISTAFILWDYSKFNLVVMMDEDSSIYKFDQSPRIDCVKIMNKIAKLNNQRLILTTYSLSMHSYVEMLKSHYELVEFEKNEDSQLIIHDMMKDLRNLNYNPVSLDLINRINELTKENKKSILVINNRSYAKNIYCMDCRKTIVCPKCKVPLMYQKEKGLYKCPTCFYKEKAGECHVCHNKNITYTGFGMEQVLEYLHSQNIRAYLFDSSSFNSLDELNDLIDLNRIDVIVTNYNQFISIKNESIYLSAFVDFDTFLSSPSFNARIRSYNAVEYAVGKTKEVWIQTLNPMHPVIVDFIKGNNDDFYLKEIKERENLKLKPIYAVDQILIKAPYGEMLKIASTIKKTILSLLKDTIIIGPSYNYKEQKAQLIVKTLDKNANNVYLRIYEMYQKTGVLIIIDRNSDNFG